jgi:hypothetical protein
MEGKHVSIVSIRTQVPNATPYTAPVTFTFFVPDSELVALSIWTTTSGVDYTKIGWLLSDPSGPLFPDMGSDAGPGTIPALVAHGAYAPFLPASQWVDDLSEKLEGPPYRLTLKIYNEDAAAIAVHALFKVRKWQKSEEIKVLTLADVQTLLAGIVKPADIPDNG